MARTTKTAKAVSNTYLIKVSQQEYDLLKAAAELEHRSVTSFILASALDAAAAINK